MATKTADRPATQSAPKEAPRDNLPAKAPHPLDVLKQQVQEREDEFRFALPKHIPADRFVRVVTTAVQNNLGLIRCDRASFFNAALRAAQDGLLPDGREGAIVEFKDKSGKVLAQWMPMYQGLLKKVRNSGEFVWVTAQVVYQGDEFNHWIDQNGEHFEHKPAGLSETPLKAYAAVTTKSGGCFVEVMTVGQVKKVQASSRAKSEYGPWAKWWDEMAKKTAFRRLAKRLPLSSDLDDLIRHDDHLYDFESSREEQTERSSAKRISSTASAFDRFAGGDATDSAGQVIEHDEVTGEATDAERAEFAGATGEADQVAAQSSADKEAGSTAAAGGAPASKPVASPDNVAAKEPGAATVANDASSSTSQAQDGFPEDDQVDGADRPWPPGTAPTDATEYARYFDSRLAALTKADEWVSFVTWWNSDDEGTLRKACKIGADQQRTLQNKAVAHKKSITGAAT